MEILKLATTGSVDDGKSTLIGRLLHDTNSLPKDRLESIRKVSEKRGNGELDLSLITDGLMDEREQGITIDVAHIYFHSNERKFIIADTPGHVEYTRNMITGASQSHVSLILIDARNGVSEQTKRHLFIANLLRMEKVLVVINKMDLIEYSEERFYEIASEIQEYLKNTRLEIPADFIPVSSKIGDNVVDPSKQMDWYKGTTLLERLNQLEVRTEKLPGRFMIQMSIRPQSDDFHDFRGYAGKVKSGSFEIGQEVDLGQGRTSKIAEIYSGKDKIKKAETGRSVNLTLEDDIDLSRGNWMFEKGTALEPVKNIQATIAWLNPSEFRAQTKYILQHGVSRTPVKFKSINAVWDILKGTQYDYNGEPIGMNDLFEAEIQLATALPFDSFKSNRHMGSFILIHPQTNQTVAVGVVE